MINNLVVIFFYVVILICKEFVFVVIVFREYVTCGYEVIFFSHRELCLSKHEKSKRKIKLLSLLHPPRVYECVPALHPR